MFHIDWDLNELSIVKTITSKNNNYKLFLNLSKPFIQLGSSAKPNEQKSASAWELLNQMVTIGPLIVY